jgi:hypothetical protein
MFDAKFSLFSFLSGPIVQVKNRLAESSEYKRRAPVAAKFCEVIFETLDDFNTNGPDAARALIQSSFAGGYSL